MAEVVPSYSPSMDIQISSNFERFLYDLLGQDTARLKDCMAKFKQDGAFKVDGDVFDNAKRQFVASRCSDEDTVAVIRSVYEECGEIIDPHTAVGIHGLRQTGLIHNGPCVSLACAHPAKFPDVVEQAIGIRPSLPDQLSDLMDRPEKYKTMAKDFEALKAHLSSV